MTQMSMRSRMQIVASRFPASLTHSRPPEPRKLPQQSRSKMLVMSIQQACFEVFKRSDADRVTMNVIAEHAGVTMGSIYQYFNGIDSVIGSIYESVIQRAFRRAEQATPSRVDVAKLEKQLADFDALFARNYYRDFYRHTLAMNGWLTGDYPCRSTEQT